jgi:hypothetical protein
MSVIVEAMEQILVNVENVEEQDKKFEPTLNCNKNHNTKIRLYVRVYLQFTSFLLLNLTMIVL